jgi:hypothetical protein
MAEIMAYFASVIFGPVISGTSQTFHFTSEVNATVVNWGNRQNEAMTVRRTLPTR